MKLFNETHWQTKQLRAIIARVAETELTPEQRKRLKVRIVYARRHGWSTGCAAYGGSWIRVRVQFDSVNKSDFAMVCAHEMAHTRGMTHRQMGSQPAYLRMPRTAELYAWACDMPVERRLAVKRSTDEQRNDRHSHVIRMVAKWARKAKTAKTMLKKWERKQKYYERKEETTAVEAIQSAAAQADCSPSVEIDQARSTRH